MGSELLTVELSGSPYDDGVRHGRAAAALIAQNLEVYYDRFQREARLPPAEVRERARRYLPVIAAADPGYVQGMRGVSAGAGLPLLDIAVLNTRYEILYSQYSLINRRLAATLEPDGCTAFAVLPAAATDGHLWLGQNWDWFPNVRGLLVHLRRPDGFAIAAFTEAGIVGGKIGMNSAGLGLAINGLLSDRDDWARLRTPFHVRTWQILHRQTLAEAAAVVTDEPRACSANFLIGKANGPGEVLNVEAAPEAVRRLQAAGGILVHTNHFVDPAALGVGQPLAEEKLSTYPREARMRRMLATARAAGTLDRAGLQAILADHEGHPDSVCRHPNPELREEERVQTVISVLQDLTARRMYVAGGTPCTHAFAELVL